MVKQRLKTYSVDNNVSAVIERDRLSICRQPARTKIVVEAGQLAPQCAAGLLLRAVGPEEGRQLVTTLHIAGFGQIDQNGQALAPHDLNLGGVNGYVWRAKEIQR